MTPVVVSTGLGRGPWVAQCLDSIHRGDVTVFRSDSGGELGAIRGIWEHTRWPRWLMLQDSVEVVDQAFFDLVDKTAGPALVAPHPSMYLAIYERVVLDSIDIPVITDGCRERAIELETVFMDAYVTAAQAMGHEVPVLCPTLTDRHAARQEHRHGRLNLVLECQHLRKWKGTWR